MVTSARLTVDGGSLTRRYARIVHANAQRSWSEREGVILELRAGPWVGRGEAAPLPGYSKDDLETATRELDGVWSRLSSFHAHDDVRTTFRRAAAETGVVSSSAVFALETALLDLVAQARQRPSWAVLRGDDEARPIPLNGIAEGATVEELVASAERARARGLSVIKIKVGAGGSVARDVERLAAVRAALGDAVALRLDANQALAPEVVADALAALAPFRPELVEEPSRPAGLAGLEKSPVPLALDESLMDDDAARRIVELGHRGLLRAVVLKPMALGGLDRSLALADAAASVGLAAVVTHMFDGPVASASAATLALAIRSQVLACGLDAQTGQGGGSRFEDGVHLSAIGPQFVVPFTESGLGVRRIG